MEVEAGGGIERLISLPLKALAQSIPDYSEISVLYLLTREQFIFFYIFKALEMIPSLVMVSISASSERAVAYSVSIRPHSETMQAISQGEIPRTTEAPS